MTRPALVEVVVFGCDWLCQQIEQIEGVLLERKPPEAEKVAWPAETGLPDGARPSRRNHQEAGMPQECTSPGPNARGRLGFGWGAFELEKEGLDGDLTSCMTGCQKHRTVTSPGTIAMRNVINRTQDSHEGIPRTAPPQ